MDFLLQQVVSGLATGSIYAIFALALVMIFNSTNHINFAQGEMALLSTYFAWTLLATGMPYWLVFIATVAVSFMLGVILERMVLRAFSGAPDLSLVVVFVGLLLSFNALTGLLWGYLVKDFPSPVRSFSTGSALVGPHEVYVLTVTLILVVMMFVFFKFTKLGLAMRAAAMNSTSSQLVGIRVGWILALGWGMAGSLGAVAGMLIAPVVYLSNDMMLGVLLYAFASAMLGGLTSPMGAVIGGLLFGVMENLAGTYLIGHELKMPFALLIVVVVLLVKPAGLFGTVTVKRV